MTNIQLTDCQSKAVDGILEFINSDFNPTAFVIGLTGAGGTGKTFVTKYVIDNYKYSKSTIRCTSPTHKACRVFSYAIGGERVETIQSTLGLRLDLKLENFDPNKPQFNPNGSHKLDGISLLIVDEASMLPAKLVNYIIKVGRDERIKVLFIGDASQLPPVNERFSTAFGKCKNVYVLNQIVRQEEENPITNLLKMLRDDIDNNTMNFLTYVSKNKNTDHHLPCQERGYTICNKQDFKQIVDTSFNDDAYLKDIDLYKIIAYTNKAVTNWNTYIRNNIIKDSDKNIITKHDLIMSYETIVDDFLSITLNNSEDYIVKDIINYTDSKYGFKGFMVKFQMVHGGKITPSIFILDHNDSYTRELYHKIITNLLAEGTNATIATRASKWKAFYEFKRKYLLATNILSNGKILYSRSIDYGFAVTSHKSQGSTYSNVFVDVNDMVYDKYGKVYVDRVELLRRLYVACSRARNSLILCFE